MPPTPVWLYFTKFTEGKFSKVKCKKCSQVFTFCNSTSTLIVHLRKAHKIEFQTNAPKTTARKRVRSETECEADEDDVSVVSASSSSTEVSEVPATLTSKYPPVGRPAGGPGFSCSVAAHGDKTNRCRPGRVLSVLHSELFFAGAAD